MEVFMRWLGLLLFCLVLLPVAVCAQEAMPAAPTFLDGIIKALESIPGTVIALIMSVVEVALRWFPTWKPLSLLIPIKYVIDGVGKILMLLSAWVDALIKVANNVKS